MIRRPPSSPLLPYTTLFRSRLHLASLLALFSAPRRHALHFQEKRRRDGLSRAAVSGDSAGVLRRVPLHAVLEHQLRALRGRVRRRGPCRRCDHGARHSALFLRAEEMTLTELRYIVAVARERHFGHAAEACFVSQPTLSVAV